LCREFTRLKVLYPVHPNPNGRGTVEKMLSGHAQIELSEPLSYPDMVAAMQHARLILTDSGGMQKEAFFYGVPCVTMRDETEWVETVELGVARVTGTAR
jgi:UDP-N-acetylglucosamine 2-epimerase